MKPPPHRRRPEPYYKVQFRDPVTLSWKDRRKEAFDTLEEALRFREEAPADVETRIVEWQDGARALTEEEIGNRQ